MKGKSFLSASVVGILLLAGCDDRPKSNVKTSQPPAASSAQVASATEPKPVEPSATQTKPPATQPAETPHSTFQIQDARTGQTMAFDFPLARLHIDRDAKKAVLYSDDPKNAIDSKYTGNGYYLEIPLTDDSLQMLNGYQWHYKAASSEHQDSTDGIFLKGQRYHLQPSDVTVTFTGASPMVIVNVQGSFYQFDMNQSTLEGKLMKVQGSVNATVDAAK
jgi:hypothetical protein